MSSFAKISAFAKTEVSFLKAKTMADAALAQARQPHEAVIGPAEEKLNLVASAVERISIAHEAAVSDHQAIKATRAKLNGGSIAGALDAAVAQAEAAATSVEEALVAARNVCAQVAAELVAAQTPIKTMLDLCAALAQVGLELRAEGRTVDRALDAYAEAETRRRNIQEGTLHNNSPGAY